MIVGAVDATKFASFGQDLAVIAPEDGSEKVEDLLNEHRCDPEQERPGEEFAGDVDWHDFRCVIGRSSSHIGSMGKAFDLIEEVSRHTGPPLAGIAGKGSGEAPSGMGLPFM